MAKVNLNRDMFYNVFISESMPEVIEPAAVQELIKKFKKAGKKIAGKIADEVINQYIIVVEHQIDFQSANDKYLIRFIKRKDVHF